MEDNHNEDSDETKPEIHAEGGFLENIKVKNFERKDQLFPQTKTAPKYSVGVKSTKGLELKLADPRVNRVALALMDMQAVMGGAASHWGGPSAFAEIVSALYAWVFHLANRVNRPWYELFHLINDAGHCENGLYAVRANYGMGISFSDLKGFRSIHSPLTGHGEAHLFPEGVYLSNGPLGSTLAQAQGLCMADSLTGLKRSTLVLMSDGACMEGEAKEAFNSIPGFFKKNKMNPFIVIVSDNNTKLSGRIDKDSFSLSPFFDSLPVLGWEYRELPSANDLQSCVDVLEEILNLPFSSLKEKPIVIRAKTVKGYGVKKTRLADHGGHGFPLKDVEQLPEFLEEIYAGKDIPDEFMKWMRELSEPHLLPENSLSRVSPLCDGGGVETASGKGESQTQSFSFTGKRVKVQEGIGRALIYCCEEKKWPVVSVSADLQGSTGVLAFRKKFPQFSFDMGVAEANMISTAAGFSKQGFIPVVDTFAQFGVTKGALPLFMANLSQAPVIAVFSHAGLQDAADGASHQCLTYFAQTGAIPMTDVYCLSCSEEAFSLMTQAIESFALAYKNGAVPRTQIFFLGRETFPFSYLPKGYVYGLGKAQIIHSQLENKKKGITLWSAGTLLEQALSAGQILSKKGWKTIVVNASIINHPDMETLLSCLKKTDFRLLTIEDHHSTGGMGALAAQALSLKGVKADMRSLAVHSDFGRSAYKSSELYKQERLMSEDIVKAVLSYWP